MLVFFRLAVSDAFLVCGLADGFLLRRLGLDIVANHALERARLVDRAFGTASDNGNRAKLHGVLRLRLVPWMLRPSSVGRCWAHLMPCSADPRPPRPAPRPPGPTSPTIRAAFSPFAPIAALWSHSATTPCAALENSAPLMSHPSQPQWSSP